MKRMMILMCMVLASACNRDNSVDTKDGNTLTNYPHPHAPADKSKDTLTGYPRAHDPSGITPPDMTVYNPQNPNGNGPAAIDLGSSGTYVILAKSGITNVTGSLITGGNLGVSPIDDTAITGFALVADASNQFDTSVSVASPWKIFAANFAPPTPGNLTVDVLAMQAAYVDGQGRTTPDFLNLNSGELGGLTLTPGLYTFGTSVGISNDVTFSGGPNDVWIIQISNDLTEAAAMNVILSGGAQAKNIFWVLAGQMTVGTTAHMAGVVLCNTGCTLQTNASLLGRMLCQTLVALDDNAITAP